MPVHLFDRQQLPAMPWKNGGGVTREIVCQPPGAGMDAFDWRVSIAHIASNGPFSRFAQVDRVITLLEGAGVHLHSSDGAVDHRLDRPWVPFAFSGEAPVQGDLIAEDCHDFNVMTRRGRCRARVVVVREGGSLPHTVEGLVMALAGRWQLTSASSALSDSSGLRAGVGTDLDTFWALTANQGLWWQDGGGPVELRPDAQHGPGALLAVSIEREHA
ncbi:HutD [Hylemonella gracilis str. Niagara R]|uniref:HutD n=1 Tax=Hylemonella gracilis str. Niagara R TaxID=1458275 RepID=A0A016XDA1_9BURK|nr:HutD family protein [Hylemonella gracilis]EYC49816.1 HutD [Hylemonella gracilis str. Niagara R]